MSVPGMLAADRIGRRPLMMYGAAGMAVSQLIVAAVGVAVDTSNQAGQKALVAFVCIYIAHFASTWGILAWVITSEIYPYELRGKGMSLSTATQWLFNFAIGVSTAQPLMLEFLKWSWIESLSSFSTQHLTSLMLLQEVQVWKPTSSGSGVAAVVSLSYSLIS